MHINNPDQKIELESLLKDFPGFLHRASYLFDSLAAPFQQTMVLFGAGNNGRKTLAFLRQIGLEPLAFADNKKDLWFTQIDGLTVLPPLLAAEKYGDLAVFIVTIFNFTTRFSDVRAQLLGLGCRRVVSFAHLAWKYPQNFLPYYCLDVPGYIQDQVEQIQKAFSLLEDEPSRREFLAQLQWRLSLDFDALEPPTKEEQYFPSFLPPCNERAVFVDCGAYDGDTLKSFLKYCEHQFQAILAVEPDPLNFKVLQRFVDCLPAETRQNIHTHWAAVGDRQGGFLFDATGTSSSAISNQGGVFVQSIMLDALLSQYRPTHIKMDIEGFERQAIRGAQNTIAKHRPNLAVCVYHRPDDLWAIPLIIKEINPDYRFYIRRYMQDCWDVVCYAVPR